MRLRIGSAVAVLALAVSMAASALAQVEDGPPPIEPAVAAPGMDQPGGTPPLFLILTSPVDQDLEVPLETGQLTIQGSTLPGAVVSVDGDVVVIDDQGTFVWVTVLDEGANDIEVVASDDQGNEVNTSILVTRGY